MNAYPLALVVVACAGVGSLLSAQQQLPQPPISDVLPPQVRLLDPFAANVQVASQPQVSKVLAAGTMLHLGETLDVAAVNVAFGTGVKAEGRLTLQSGELGSTRLLLYGRGVTAPGLADPFERSGQVHFDLLLYLSAAQRTQWNFHLSGNTQGTSGPGLGCFQVLADAGNDGIVDASMTCVMAATDITFAYTAAPGTLAVRVAGDGSVWSSEATPDDFLYDLTLEAVPTPAADFQAFGSGCAGSGGVAKLVAVAGSLPQPGAEFMLRVDGLAIGAATPVFGVTSLMAPVMRDLTDLGMPGCWQYLQAPMQGWLLQKVSGGSAMWPVPIPNDSRLLGVSFLVQAVVVDPPANPFGVVSSNAARVVVGL